MNCSECQEMLAGYVEEVLDQTALSEVARHLLECPECQALAAEFSQLRDQLVAAGSTFQRTSLEDQVMNRIVQQGTSASRRLTMFKRYARTGFGFAAAAAIIVAVGAFFFTGMQGSTASAAVMLRAAAAVNKAFDGWVRARMDNPQAMNRPSEGLTVTAATFYLHPIKRITVRDVTVNGIRSVEWMDHQANMHKSYDSSTNTITTGPIPQEEKGDGASVEEMIAKMMSQEKATPWQIGQRLFAMPTLDGAMMLVDNNWCSVTASREGEDDRYTLTFNKDKLTNPRDAVKSSLVLLVDRKTSLVRKWIGTFPDGDMSLTFTYNDPVLNDIQDVGLPADTRINSPQAATTQPTADAAALLDRLDKLAAMDGQLGTYTAVVTQTNEDSEGREGRRTLQIWGRQGKSQFFGLYRDQKLTPFLNSLGDWPLPSVVDALAAAQRIRPDIVLASDGVTAKIGRTDRGKSGSWWPIDLEDLTTPQNTGYTLTGGLWPGRHMIDYKHGSRIKIDVRLLTAEDRPGQVGLQVDESGTVAVVMGMSNMQMTWWVDPSRNDVPVAKIRRIYDLQGKVKSEETTKYTQYAQFPNGLWYPTAWEMTSSRNTTGQPRVEAKATSRLQFIPNMTMDSVWFSDPQERFEPAAPQQTTSQPGAAQ